MAKIKGWTRTYTQNGTQYYWMNDNSDVHAMVTNKHFGGGNKDVWIGIVADTRPQFQYEDRIIDITGKREEVYKKVIKYMRSHPNG